MPHDRVGEEIQDRDVGDANAVDCEGERAVPGRGHESQARHDRRAEPSHPHIGGAVTEAYNHADPGRLTPRELVEISLGYRRVLDPERADIQHLELARLHERRRPA